MAVKRHCADDARRKRDAVSTVSYRCESPGMEKGAPRVEGRKEGSARRTAVPAEVLSVGSRSV